MGGAGKRKRKRDVGRDRIVKQEDAGRKQKKSTGGQSDSKKAATAILDEGVRTSGFACICGATPCYCGAAEDEEAADLPLKPSDGVKTCFNCGEAGHLSADCTQPRSHNKFKSSGDKASNVCFKCRQVGHMSFECVYAGAKVKKKKGTVRRDILPLPAKKVESMAESRASE